MYDQVTLKAMIPARSPKLSSAFLVLGWVTTNKQKIL